MARRVYDPDSFSSPGGEWLNPDGAHRADPTHALLQNGENGWLIADVGAAIASFPLPEGSKVVGLGARATFQNPSVDDSDFPYVVRVQNTFFGPSWVMVPDLLLKPGDYVEVECYGLFLDLWREAGGYVPLATKTIHPEGRYSGANSTAIDVYPPSTVDTSKDGYPDNNWIDSGATPMAALVRIENDGVNIASASASKTGSLTVPTRQRVFTPAELPADAGGSRVWLSLNVPKFTMLAPILPADTPIGEFVFIVRRRRSPSSPLVRLDTTVTVPISSPGWIQGPQVAADEWVEISVDGRGTRGPSGGAIHPEGYYDPADDGIGDLYGSHGHEPCDVYDDLDIAKGVLADNVAKYPLVMSIRETVPPGENIADGYRPTRHAYYDPERLAPGYLYFGTNEGTADHADNTGSLRVRVRIVRRPVPVINLVTVCVFDDPPFTPGLPTGYVEFSPPSSGLSRIQVAVDDTASAPLVVPWVADAWSLVWRTVEFGGIGHLWEKAPGYWDDPLNLEALKIFVRRPNSSDENLEDSRYVTGLWLEIYYRDGDSMAERETVKKTIQFGLEGTYGTRETTTRRYRSIDLDFVPDADFKSHRPQGEKLPSHSMLMREMSRSGITGQPSYDEMGYLLKSAIGSVVSTGAGAGAKNRHEFVFDNRGDSNRYGQTIQIGQATSRVHEVVGAIVNELGVEFSRGNSPVSELSGAMFAKAIDDEDVEFDAGADEVQTLTITATGGNYQLWFKGEPTSNLAFGANAAAIETALNALSTIGANGVSVAGTGPYTITFDGTAFTGTNVPEIVVKSVDLTGGTASILTTTQGGVTELDFVPILPEEVSVYLASSYAGLAAGQLTRGHLTGFAITDRWGPYWVLNGASRDFETVVELPLSARFRIELQADSNGMALLANARAEDLLYVRMEAVSSKIIAGSDPYKFGVDAAVKIAALGEFADNEGVYQTNYELVSVEDPARNFAFSAFLENGLADYDS